ncbi:MAG: hypothetical protein PHO15_07810 [Eubacteriales bacterium]|nr:hypothetical protein [Eubacteriales bacterium]
MAEVRIPFCATAELGAPFMLDEGYANPNGVKSVFFDKSGLKIMAVHEAVEVPDIGTVQMCVFHVTGTIPYICCAFPVIQSAAGYDVQENSAKFNAQTGTTASDCAATDTDTPLGWISAVGCVDVDQSIGASCSLDDAPAIVNVTVDNLAVANNLTSAMAPVCPDAAVPCGEEEKRVVKWRGCFVITTSNE